LNPVLRPNHYQVNETWITFQLNDAPVITDKDGDFNVFALMDAASCFILGIGYVPTDSQEMSQMEAERLLKVGYSHKKQYPKELIIPNNQVANVLSGEAERRRINVARVPEEQLKVFIGEARESFQEHISKNRVQ
jgi:hypothetical protein